MHTKFIEASTKEFHRVMKRWFFAWCYGSLQGEQVSNDMWSAYQAGGEL